MKSESNSLEENKEDIARNNTLEELSFEEAMSELEKVVAKLQKSELSLDESMQLFQHGTELSKLCKEKLDNAEQQVKILVSSEEGIVEKDFLEEES